MILIYYTIHTMMCMTCYAGTRNATQAYAIEYNNSIIVVYHVNLYFSNILLYAQPVAHL